MSWRKTSLYQCTASLYLCTASLYLCTVSLYLEKVVASKQHKFDTEKDIERKARLEKMVATTQLRGWPWRKVGGQNNNNRSINLLKVITFCTDYKYNTYPYSLSYTISVYQ